MVQDSVLFQVLLFVILAKTILAELRITFLEAILLAVEHTQAVMATELAARLAEH
jgi:hypothetical protein